ncbi:MAG: hypothetical protein ACMXYG_06365 [Candidatus Woesearchaeota archaeon]
MKDKHIIKVNCILANYTNFLKNKNSASPIVATVILFFVALFIGFGVANLTPILTDPKVCNSIENVIVKVDNNNFCYTSLNETHNSFMFRIENNVNSPVYGYRITLVGDIDIDVTRNYDSIVAPYASVSINHIFPKIGFIKSARISFYRKLGNDLILCESDFINFNYIDLCD